MLVWYDQVFRQICIFIDYFLPIFMYIVVWVSLNLASKKYGFMVNLYGYLIPFDPQSNIVLPFTWKNLGQ